MTADVHHSPERRRGTVEWGQCISLCTAVELDGIDWYGLRGGGWWRDRQWCGAASVSQGCEFDEGVGWPPGAGHQTPTWVTLTLSAWLPAWLVALPCNIIKVAQLFSPNGEFLYRSPEP